MLTHPTTFVRRTARQSVLVVGTAAALVLVTRAASAEDGWGTVDCSQAPTPQCQLEVGTSGHSSSGSSSAGDQTADGGGDGEGGNLSTCAYQPSAFHGPPSAAGSTWQVPAAWYEGTCSLTGAIHNPTLVPSLSPADVAQLARAQLGLPKSTIAANPAVDQLVNLSTWLWLEGGWETVSATASIPGVSVTAIASPTSVSWSTGDGAEITCEGPGTPFHTSADPSSPSPDCGHTYRHSSATQPGNAYPVTATVHWSVSWSGGGASGIFPEMTTSSETRFRVSESQALNVPGPR
jgi:hypothetical protein